MVHNIHAQSHAQSHDSHMIRAPPQIPERLMMTLELLKKEQAVATLQQKLGKEVGHWSPWKQDCDYVGWEGLLG